MLLTEEQAKKKWCPLVRALTDGKASGNCTTDVRFAKQSLCIGSNCMFWRWGDNEPRPEDLYDVHQMYRFRDVPHDDFIKHVVETRRGYCGAAGKPFTTNP